MYYYGGFYRSGLDFETYMILLVALAICGIFSLIASSKVRSTFKKYDRTPCRSGLTGEQTARRLLQMNGVNDIAVGRVGGELSDHYHPTQRIVNLSTSTHDSSSVAAVAVAAHEIGHVMQKKERYGLYQLRTVLVPLVNFGSRLALPLVLVGILLDLFVQLSNENLGFYIALVGVALYGSSLLFALVTLPVELNASRRAGAMLAEAGVLREDEMPAARKVLSAAAMTYLASVMVSLVYFLRFLLYVLAAFGRNNRR